MPKPPGKVASSAADPLAQRGEWLGAGFSGRVVTWMRSIWRRRWLSLATAWATCMIGWAAIALWPTSYSSSAVIYAETDELSSESGAGSPNRAPVAILREVLLAADNLDAVRKQIDLDGERSQNLSSDIMLRPTVPPVFVAAYHHEDPSIARNVLQTLLTNAMTARVTATATADETAALDGEIEEHRRRLEAVEEEVAKFRRVNSDHLEGADVRGAKFALLQEEAQSLEQQVEAATTRRDQVAADLAEAPASDEPRPEAAAPAVAGPVKSIEEIEREQATLQTELAKLRERYADSHPYVVAVLDAIETLEADATASVREEEAVDAAIADDAPAIDRQALEEQHKEHIAQVSALNNDLAKKRREIDLLQTLTNTTTSVEAELADLLAAKSKLEEALAVSTARRDELEGQTDKKTGQASFRLIKEPDLPTRPIGPSRLLALVVVLLGGIVLGAAVAVLRNHYKGVFESAWQLKQRFDVGVLGTISEVLTPTERKQLGYSRLMFGLGCLALVSVFSGLMIAEANNLLALWGESLRVRLLG